MVNADLSAALNIAYKLKYSIKLVSIKGCMVIHDKVERGIVRDSIMETLPFLGWGNHIYV